MENLLFGQAMDYMAAPFWHEPVWLTQAMPTGSDTAYVTSTAYSQFKAGQWALAISPSGGYNLLKVVTVGANQLTFSNLTTQLFKVRHEIIPVSQCVAESIAVSERMTHSVYDMKVLVEPIDNDLGMSPYQDGELVITDVNYVKNLKGTYSRPHYRQDSLGGGFLQTVLANHADKGSMVGFVTHNRSELWQLRTMLNRLGGKRTSFFLASFSKEIIPSLGLETAGTTLTIEACGYTDFAQGGRGKIRVVLTNGTVIERIVLSSVYISGAAERLTVDAAWGQTVTVDDIDRIEYLDLVRLDTDDVMIVHQNAIGSAYCEAPVTLLDCPLAPVTGNPIGLLLALTY
jgi:hypothetical protein